MKQSELLVTAAVFHARETMRSMRARIATLEAENKRLRELSDAADAWSAARDRYLSAQTAENSAELCAMRDVLADIRRARAALATETQT